MAQSPPNIDTSLRGAWMRQRVFAHLRGACIFVASAVGLLLIDLLLDWGLGLPKWGRAALSAGNIGAMAAIGYFFWWRHLRRFSPLQLALRVEQQNPKLNTLLVSYVQFAAEPPAAGVSSQLTRAAQEQAVQAAAGVDFARLVNFATLRGVAAGAIGAVAAIVALGVWQPDMLATLLARLANPASAAEYATSTQVEAITGNITQRQGQSVRVEAQAHGQVPSSGKLFVKSGAGAWEATQITGDSGRFAHVFESVYQDFDYYFAANDGRSTTFHVTVVPPPRIAESKIILRNPPYTGLGTQTAYAMNLNVPEDTLVQWRLTMDRPMRRVRMYRGASWIRPRVRLRDGGRVICADAWARSSLPYWFRWTDREHGYGYESPRHYIQMTPDRGPLVGLTAPAADMKATVKLKLPVAYWARDDWGVGEAWIVYSLNDSKEERQSRIADLGLRIEGGANPQSHYDWNVKASIPELKEGDIVTMAIEVADNRLIADKTPHHARSRSVRIQFVSEVDYLADVAARRSRLLGSLRPMYLQERQAAEHVRQMGGKEAMP